MNWFEWLLATINKEYDRRVRVASEIDEYGMHHGHGHGHAHTPDHEADNEGDVEISNVPPGTHVHAPADNHPTTDTHAEKTH